jgi:hypothetical protein
MQSDPIQTQPPIRRIGRARRVSLERSILSALIAGGALGLCGVMVFIAIVGAGSPTPSERPTAIVVTVTPSPLAPTAPSPPTPSASPTPEGLYLGGYARVQGTGGDTLRLRADPGLQTTTLKTVDEGALLEVLDGPREADGIRWWRLRDLNDGAEGWAAQQFLVQSGPP